MKLKIEVTVVAEEDVDPEDWKDDDGALMSEAQIIEQIENDTKDDFFGAVDNFSFKAEKVNVTKID